jgi:ABC-type branched-subunit amino acid transport system substrate-binding protein
MVRLPVGRVPHQRQKGGRMFGRTLKISAAITAIALLAAACGSSSSGTSTTTSSGPKLSGAPIVVGQIVPLTGAALQLPQLAAGTAAAVKYYNNHGGIQGHPIKLVQCDTKDDPNTEVQCAQTMVADHAVATIGDTIAYNPAAVQSTLTAAGIPRIGILTTAVPEYQASTNYAVDGGAILALGAMVVELIKSGHTKVTMVTSDTPAASQLTSLLDPIAKAAGGDLVNLVLIPGTATDYTQFWTQAAANGATGAALALPAAQALAMVKVYNQIQPKLVTSTSSGVFSSQDLSKLKPWSTSAEFSAGVPGADDPSVKGLSNVNTILQQGGSGLTPTTTEGDPIITVLAMHALVTVADGIKGAVTAKSVNAAMQAAKDINMWGVVPAWSPGVHVNVGSLNSFFNNVSNPYFWTIGYNGSHFTNKGQFDMVKYMPGAAS